MEKIQVEIAGLHQAPTGTGAYALILKESHGNRRLPIIIGAFEAQSIAMAIDGIKPPRPLTHDLMINLIEALGATLVEIIIDELRDNTFYAKLILDISSMTQEIDSRPSDAIALSVRYKCPIFVNELVLREAGFEIDPEIEKSIEKSIDYEEEDEEEDKEIFNYKEPKEKNEEKSSPPRSKESRISQLQAQLKEAIEKEEYERAAKIRDELKKLNSEGN